MRIRIFLLAMALGVFPSIALAGGALSEEMQAVLVTKILMYDNNLAKTVKNNVVTVGLLYSEQSRGRLQSLSAEFSKLKDKGARIGNYAVDYCPVVMTGKDELAEDIKAKKINVLFLLDGVNNVSVITGVTRSMGVISVAGENPEAAVSKGVAIGLTTENNKPTILVNLQSAVKEGCDFSAQFLSLVKIVK